MSTPAALSVSSLFSVAGKVAVVTGGSRGIGEMIAAGLLANGAKVYISPMPRDPPVTRTTLPVTENKSSIRTPTIMADRNPAGRVRVMR